MTRSFSTLLIAAMVCGLLSITSAQAQSNATTTQTGNPPPPVVVPTRQGSVPLTVRLCSKAQKQGAAFHFEFGDGTHAEAKANTKESICSIADLKCDDSGYYDACVSHTYTRIRTYTATVSSASAVVSQQTIIATAPRAKR